MACWLLTLALLLVAPSAALAAREPVISYVHDNGNGTSTFRLYDEQTEAEVEPPPPVPVADAATFRYGMSLDGRYIAFLDGAKKIHLLDRATNTELPLPGIDVHTNPQNLSVSNTGLIAFDENINGGAVAYDSTAKSFIETGLPDPNGHRQTRLSGDGRFLATTCMAQCVVDTGGGTEAFVQDLTTRTDTAFPFDTTRDEEHTCINGDGSFLGFDKNRGGMIIKKDIFLFDRSQSPPAAVALGTGVNDAAEDEVYCVLDSTADHLGFMNDFLTFQVYEQSNSKFLMLPPDKEFDRYSLFSAPYSPPPPPPPPPPCCAPPPDVTKPVAQRFRISHRRFRPHRGATKFRFVLSEVANVRIRFKRHGKSVGALTRRHLEAGPNAISFSGRVRGHRLRPGRYVAVLTATDAAGNRSRPRSIRFTILQAGGDGRH